MAFCLKMKSDYSFLSSTITFDDVISFCKQNKIQHASLIDNNLYGALPFYDICIKNNIKPIIGIEINIKYNEGVFPLVFVALNYLGYKNICQLSSLVNKYQKKYLEFDEAKLYSSDVALVISSEDSYLSNKIKDGQLDELNSFVTDVKKTFANYYVGIYRYKGVDNQLLISIKEYANNNNITCLAMQYAVHQNEKDTIILNLLDCIKKGIPANKDFLNNNKIVEAYLKEPEKLKIFYDKDELDNLMTFAKNVFIKIPKVDFSLPLVYENPDEVLKKKAMEALNSKGLENKQYIDRLNYEIKVISEMGFSNYYLVVEDYVNYAKTHDIPVGPARGSGAASLVAYLLNITTIDPLKYNLLFERFLNPSRINYPDFDIDFADVKRDEIIKYVKEKYGYRKVGHIATFSTFGSKSAIRDLGRILKTPNDDIDYIVKSLSNDCKSINDEYNNNPKFKSLLDIHGNFKSLCGLASQIEGLKKQVGLHAAGIILSKDNLDEIVPCFEPEQDTIAIQYDYVTAEKLGMIKMDFLGLKNLSIIEYCLKAINAKENTNYSIDNFYYDDKSSYDLIASNNNIGIFQLEGEGIGNVVNRMKPNCFDDIVAILALYRPGPLKMIDTYIDRKFGKPFTYIDESLKDILSPTYGIIIYQEQIMQICQKVANYSLGEADILRRAISKKNLSMIKNEKERFINGCLSNNFSLQKANELFAYIEKFASYGFNKAHSVGYSKIVTMMAYIKSNYPAIFYEALLNVNQENGEKRKKLFFEAKKFNVCILKPSVLKSSYTFSSVGNDILFGLTNINTIKTNIAKIILEEREKETFNDLYDFIIRMVMHDVSYEILADLCYSGALDCFDISRQKIIANLRKLYDFALMFKGLDYQPNTYEDEKYSIILKPILFDEDDEIDLLKKEYELLDIYLSTHPIRKVKESSETKYIDLADITNDGFYDVIGKITLIEIRKTKENKNYLNLNLEDDTKNINIKEYKKCDFYKQEFKKGDIIKANITKRNNYIYLNSAKHI